MKLAVEARAGTSAIGGSDKIQLLRSCKKVQSRTLGGTREAWLAVRIHVSENIDSSYN
jgi:hypothetical protein